MKILIDNGHGIDTKGKRSPDGQLLEYAQNRLLAGRIVTDLKIEQPYPRDRSSKEFVEYRNEILKQLHFAGKAQK